MDIWSAVGKALHCVVVIIGTLALIYAAKVHLGLSPGICKHQKNRSIPKHRGWQMDHFLAALAAVLMPTVAILALPGTLRAIPATAASEVGTLVLQHLAAHPA